MGQQAFDKTTTEISRDELALAKERGRKALLDVLMMRVSDRVVCDRRQQADALLPGVLAALEAGGRHAPSPVDEQVDVGLVADAGDR